MKVQEGHHGLGIGENKAIRIVHMHLALNLTDLKLHAYTVAILVDMRLHFGKPALFDAIHLVCQHQFLVQLRLNSL